MIPGKFDIPCQRGGTLRITLRAKNALQQDIDFTNDYDGARLQVRPVWANNPASKVRPLLLELTTENGGLVANGQTLLITDTAAATAAYRFSNAIYELELIKTGPPEEVDKLLYGAFTVSGEINL